MRNKVLGRGLSSLISNQIVEGHPQRGEMMFHVNLLQPGKYQPRKYFDEDSLQELSDSIKKSGIIQPIIVRKTEGEHKYSIIAGERRWRAAQINGMHEVPVIVKEVDDQSALEYAIVENVQRKDLTPIEESEGYIQLAEEFGYTQEQISKIVGKSRGHVTNMMRLSNLPDQIKSMVNDGRLSMGHSRTLVGMDVVESLEIAEQIINKSLNVRQTENLVTNRKKYKQLADAGINLSSQLITEDKDNKNYSDIVSLQQSISEILGTEVFIKHQNNKGNIVIKFSNLSQLDSILQKLTA
jgi:ParB family chromosome partitioning protein